MKTEMKVIFGLVILVVAVWVWMKSDSNHKQEQLKIDTQSAIVVDNPSFNCASQDTWFVTVTDVYGYIDPNSDQLVVVLKPGLVFTISETKYTAVAVSHQEVWYLVESSLLPSYTGSIWIPGNIGGFTQLPCAPLFMK